VPSLNLGCDRAPLKWPRDQQGNFLPVYRTGAEIDGRNGVAVVHPDGLKQVLSDPVAFPKASLIYDSLSLIERDALVLLSGPTWKRDRRLLTPVFHFARLQAMVEPTARIVQQVVSRYFSWGAQAHAAGKLPPKLTICEEMSALTMRVMVDMAFGSAFDASWMANEWRGLLRFMQPHLLGRMIYGVAWDYLPVPTTLAIRWHRSRIMKRVMECIERKRAALMSSRANSSSSAPDTSLGYDLITAAVQSMLSNQDGSSAEDASESRNAPPMTTQDIANEAVGFLFAGMGRFFVFHVCILL